FLPPDSRTCTTARTGTGGKGSPPSVPAAAMEGGVQLLNRDGHSISHNSKRHYHDAFVCMNRMRQRGLLCDIVLHVATKEIKAHKVVLASCSPYFHAMFTNEMSESRQTHVTLHDIDPQALEQLVQYAYTAEIVVGEGNVQTLLPAASLLQLNGVRDACCKFLLSQLDPSNCLGIRGFADTHSCSDLLKSAHKYVLQHFVEVSKTEEFMLLPLKQVRARWQSAGLGAAELFLHHPKAQGMCTEGLGFGGDCTQILGFGSLCSACGESSVSGAESPEK
uniref:BTB domain-containing protein n=1 Tax=Malurus cyaneus samueli TaxID=2593467 RepID=A0A8C5U9X5_9PASS